VTSQLPVRATTPSPRAATRSDARRARRRPAGSPARPAVPPVERANGWVVAIAVVAGAVLFSWLAMNAFLAG
jgi:hypothetical protein